jgi:hypothetical protein
MVCSSARLAYKTNGGYKKCVQVTILKSIIFWDMTPCSPLSFNRRFGGTYRLHLQGQRNTFSKTSKHFGRPTLTRTPTTQVVGFYKLINYCWVPMKTDFIIDN